MFAEEKDIIETDSDNDSEGSDDNEGFDYSEGSMTPARAGVIDNSYVDPNNEKTRVIDRVLAIIIFTSLMLLIVCVFFKEKINEKSRIIDRVLPIIIFTSLMLLISLIVGIYNEIETEYDRTYLFTYLNKIIRAN